MDDSATKLTRLEVSFAVANSMIGLSLIYFPELFLRCGIGLGVISLIVFGCMMAYTCSMWSEHLQHNQTDIGQIVLRVLNKPTFVAFNLLSAFALSLLTMTIYLMVNQILYTLLVQLLETIGIVDHYRKTTTGIHFQEFSVQYLGLILVSLLAGLISLKNINGVLKIAKYASMLMGVFFIEILIVFADNINSDRISRSEINIWPKDFSGSVSILTTVLFALVCHPSVSVILKSAKTPLSNTKSIYIAYGFTVLLFCLVGIFGAIGLVGRQHPSGNSVMSYFAGEIYAPLLGIPILIYLVSIFSIYPHVARNQFFNMIEHFTGKENLKEKYHNVYTLAMVICMIIVDILNLNPATIISFIGGAMLWLTCFVLPCLIRLADDKGDQDVQSLISEDQLQTRRKSSVCKLEKVWIGIVMAAGTLLMIGTFYSLVISLS